MENLMFYDGVALIRFINGGVMTPTDFIKRYPIAATPFCVLSVIEVDTYNDATLLTIKTVYDLTSLKQTYEVTNSNKQEALEEIKEIKNGTQQIKESNIVEAIDAKVAAQIATLTQQIATQQDTINTLQSKIAFLVLCEAPADDVA